MNKRRSFFITASDTSVGKTIVTTSLCWQLRQRGERVVALKPIITGYSPHDTDSDSSLILQSCGREPTLKLVREISPWRFETPLSPDMAAKRERRTIELDEVIQFCNDHEDDDSTTVLVEGAGGVMAPINPRQTMLDWMDGIGWPVVLVMGNYLGALSHTLTAIETLKSRNISLHSLVVSESHTSNVPFEDTIACMRSFVPEAIQIMSIPRILAEGELWRTAPPLLSLITGSGTALK
ncbi:MAG: dethiobiotin synthase [Pirellulales bacterium]|nr:dethiobiotin synthase [Pirellulales bacterium]